MIKGAIFDMDGVILDSMGAWKDLGSRFLEGLRIRPEEGLNEILFDMSMEEGSAYLKSHYPLEMDPEEILKSIEAILRKDYFEHIPAKEGALELLSYLKEHHIPAAVATASPREHVTRALDRLGLLPYFVTVETTREVGGSKHSPVIYEYAASKIGTLPSETLVFEDSLYALRTAKKAGFQTAGVFDPDSEPDQEGMKREATYYLTALPDFFTVIQH